MNFLGILLIMTLSYGRLFVSEGMGEAILASPRSIALGGATLPSSLVPASLGIGKKSISYDFSFLLTSHAEKRSVFAYDQFDNTVGQVTVYSKSWNYLNLSYASISYKTGKRGIAVGFHPCYDLTYEYSRTEKSDAYTVLRETRETHSGKVYRTFVSVGSKIKGKFYGGLDISYYFSDLKTEEFYRALPDTENFDTTVYSMSGFGASLNLLAKNNLVTGGLILSSPVKLTGDLEQMYPLEFTFFANLRPPAKLPTNIYFLYSYKAWGSVDTAYTGGKTYYDSHRFSLGFEHLLLNHTPFMVGASIVKSYVRKDFWYPIFSFGIGYLTRNGLRIDLGTSLTPFNYDIYNGNIRYDVRESLLHISFGVSGRI